MKKEQIIVTSRQNVGGGTENQIPVIKPMAKPLPTDKINNHNIAMKARRRGKYYDYDGHPRGNISKHNTHTEEVTVYQATEVGLPAILRSVGIEVVGDMNNDLANVQFIKCTPPITPEPTVIPVKKERTVHWR